MPLCNQYRIYFWEGSTKYCKVIGTTDLEGLKRSLKKLHDRFTVEKIS